MSLFQLSDLYSCLDMDVDQVVILGMFHWDMLQ